MGVAKITLIFYFIYKDVLLSKTWGLWCGANIPYWIDIMTWRGGRGHIATLIKRASISFHISPDWI